MIAPGSPFLLATDNGTAFGVVLSPAESEASPVLIELQSGLRLSVPVRLVQAGQLLLGKLAEEVTA